MIKAILTKPLDGRPEGSRAEFSKPDFERLKAMGAVKAAPAPKPAPSPAPAPTPSPSPTPAPKPAK